MSLHNLVIGLLLDATWAQVQTVSNIVQTQSVSIALPTQTSEVIAIMATTEGQASRRFWVSFNYGDQYEGS